MIRPTMSAAIAVAALTIAGCHRKPFMWVPDQLLKTTVRDFSVRWHHLDNNGSPLNPMWAPQAQPNPQFPPLVADCGTRPDTSACTENITVKDVATLPNSIICNFEVTSKLHGHVDWTPATSVGKVLWMGIATDGDYNFRFFPKNDAGLTKNNETTAIDGVGLKPYIELEFNSHETVDLFSIPWWTTFRQTVQGTRFDRIDPLLNVNHSGTASNAVLYGLFGLDCEHACRSEYHPIYAMAIEVDDRPDHNVWALFVRNWGDEGFCAQLNHELYLPDNRLRLTLPRVGARPTVVTQQTEFRSTVDGGIPFPDLAYDSNNQAVVLTFVLPEPRQRIVGEMLLQMNWPQGFGELPPTLVRGQEPAAAAIPAQITDAESYFETLAALKPPLGQQLRDTGVPIAAAAGQAPAGLRPTTATLSSFVKSPLTSGRPMQLLSVDSRKQSNDVARWQAICAAFPDRKQLPRYKGKDISEICDKVK